MDPGFIYVCATWLLWIIGSIILLILEYRGEREIRGTDVLFSLAAWPVAPFAIGVILAAGLLAGIVVLAEATTFSNGRFHFKI